MKKSGTILNFNLLCVILILVTNVIARDFKKQAVTPKLQTNRTERITANGDTLFQGFFNCNLVLYLSTNGGFVAGNNGYGDLEKVQKYEGTGGGSLTEMLIFFGAKEVGANGDIIGKVYDVNSTSSEPGNLLGTASSVTVADIDTSGGLTTFIFDPAVQVGDNFFLGIEMSTAAGDTVGIVTTEDGCLAGTNTVSNAWEQFSNGTWVTFDDPNSWGLVVDMGIFPVLDTPTSVEEGPQTVETYQLEQNYPNPFNPSTQITFQLATNTKVTLRVYDLLGQEVATVVNDENYSAGIHTLNFNGSELSNGVYFYRIEAGNFTATRKMTLLK